MRHNQLSLEKYFDDGVVQYWRPVASDRYYIQYRLTVEPTWISIDTLGWSWNNRRCWRPVHSNIKTFQQAAALLRLLLPEESHQQMLVKETESSSWFQGYAAAMPRSSMSALICRPHYLP